MGCRPDYSVALLKQEDNLLTPASDGYLTAQAVFLQFYRPIQIYQIQLISHVITPSVNAGIHFFILIEYQKFSVSKTSITNIT